MASSGKRCLYEVLGLTIDCAADEIRTAYKKMALQLHPDKLVQSSLSHDEATAQFQELVNAYEVLSDPKERAWYDSHRSQILFSDPVSSSNSVVPDLFPYFSNSVFWGYGNTSKGFYNVYSSVFDKIYANELNFAKKLGGGLLDMVKEAPVMGNLECPYTQVTAFYNYWLGFCTVMDFCWADQYDVMAGPNRKSRRVMEDENKKTRKKAKREYNETVRGLAEFVKKRDKRVADMQVKKALEMEKKRELEKEKKRVLEEEKLRRAMAYEEPEWAKIKEKEEVIVVDDEWEENEKRSEFYCVVCGKKFKSEKQWKNHEQSKKHKEKVTELKVAYAAEMIEKARNEEVSGSDQEIVVDNPSMAKDSSSVNEQGEAEDAAESSDAGSNDTKYDNDQNVNYTTNGFEALDLEDEVIDLESMLAGRKNRKKAAATNQPHSENQTNEEEASGSMEEYNNRKTTRKTKGARRAKGKKSDADSTMVNEGDNNGQAKENNGSDSLETGKNTADSDWENGSVSQEDQRSENNHKRANRFNDKKSNSKKERGMKLKSKGMSKSSGNLCDACGEDFESKNKLHKHLGETGHASLKHR